MYSSSRNSTWISNTYTQEVGDGNWTQYQVQITGGATKLNIKTANTTSSSLAITDANVVIAGDSLTLSTNGTTFVSGVAGAVTSGISSPTLTYVSAKSAASSTNIVASTGTIGIAHKIKPDGTLMWRGNGTNIIEYSLSTPFDPSTAVVSGKSIAGGGAVGFDFSSDGRYVFVIGSSNGYITRYVLTTPWDISTIATAATRTYTGFSTTLVRPTYINTIRISPDGTKLILYAVTYATPQGVFHIINMTSPYDLNTGTLVGSVISITGGTTIGGWDISADGKRWVAFDKGTQVSSGPPLASGIITYYSASTAWNPATLSQTSTYTVTDNYFSGTLGYPGGFISPDGTSTTIFMLSGYITFNTNVNIHSNIDISSFNLGTAPIAAYTKVPNVYVQTSSSAGSINLQAKQLYMSNATTTSVTVSSTVANSIASGDTLTITVGGSNISSTVSSVVETSNGQAANANSYTYSGQFLGTSFQADGIKGMKFSPDGSKLYVVGWMASGGNGVYKYTLTTPWDLTTATVVNPTQDFFNFATTYMPVGVDIKPDGTKIYVMTQASTSVVSVREYVMSVPWELYTITDYNSNYASFAPTVLSTTYSTLRGGRLNSNGTQYYWIDDVSLNTVGQTSLRYVTLSTPYSLASAGAVNTSLAGANANFGLAATMTPDGKQLWCVGYGGVAGGTSYLGSHTEMVLPSTNDASNVTISAYSTWTGSPLSGIAPRAIELSADGNKMYIAGNATSIFQVYAPTVIQNKIVCTIPTQSAAPTNTYLPDRGVQQSLTMTVSGNTVISTGSNVSINHRNVAFKIVNTGSSANVTNATINLWK